MDGLRMPKLHRMPLSPIVRWHGAGPLMKDLYAHMRVSNKCYRDTGSDRILGCRFNSRLQNTLRLAAVQNEERTRHSLSLSCASHYDLLPVKSRQPERWISWRKTSKPTARRLN